MRKLTELTNSINDDKGEEIVKRNYDELTEAWRNVETKHDAYTIFLQDREAQASEEWIMALQQSFSEAMEQHIQYLSAKAAKKTNKKSIGKTWPKVTSIRHRR